jgi:hypothetical protein
MMMEFETNSFEGQIFFSEKNEISILHQRPAQASVTKNI